MKTNQLKIAIAAAAGAAAVYTAPSAFASLGYDSGGGPADGRARNEYHVFYQDNTYADYCSAACLGSGAADAETRTVLEVSNDPDIQNPNGGSASGGLAGTPVVDTLVQVVDASGNILGGNSIVFDTAGSVNVSEWYGLNLAAVLGLFIDDFEFTTNPEGKIIDGWFRTKLVYGGLTRCTLYDVGARRSMSMNGDNGLPENDPGFLSNCDITREQVAGVTDFLDPASGNPEGWITGVILDAASPISYITCDTETECGQFGKSVPVPAFAAGALGLGLVGVTLLTGRRRQIK